MDVVSGTDRDKAEASAQFPTVHPNPLVGLNTADLKLAIQLKELDLRVKQQEHDTQLLRVRQCELEARRVSPRPVSGLQTLMISVPSGSPVVSHVPGEVDISRQIRLVPIFRETEIDSYFSAFERIAAALHWPREIWSLLLQCRLTGKAQEVSAALSNEDSLDYDILKASVLRAYELVPEAYRQKFRGHLKAANQTFVEFAHEKGTLFDKWCQSNKINDFEQLRKLVLLEDFKNTLPEKIVVHLNERKVNTLAQAAVSADEFVLTHKNVFVASVRRESSHFGDEKNLKTVKAITANPAESRECFYCYEVGHLIAGCPVLKRKNQSPRRQGPKSVGFARVTSLPVSFDEQVIDSGYDPLVFSGVVFLTEQEDKIPILSTFYSHLFFEILGRLNPLCWAVSYHLLGIRIVVLMCWFKGLN